MDKLRQLLSMNDEKLLVDPNPIPRTSSSPPAQLRMQKEIAELDPIPGIELRFTDPDDLLDFNLLITPNEGFYEGGRFQFSVKIPAEYPFVPPKVRCQTLIWHPNIDTQGAVCLNILREDWSPVLCLSSVIFGLLNLFHEPNPHEPLNKDAAALLERDVAKYAFVVRRTLQGGPMFGLDFKPVLST